MGGANEEYSSPAPALEDASYHVFKYVARVVNDQVSSPQQQQVTRRNYVNRSTRVVNNINVVPETELSLESHMIASWCEIKHPNNTSATTSNDHSCMIQDANLKSPRKPALLISVRASPCTTVQSSKGLVSIKLLRHLAYCLSALLSVVVLSLTLLHIGGQDVNVDDARLPGAMMLFRQDFLFQSSSPQLAVLSEDVRHRVAAGLERPDLVRPNNVNNTSSGKGKSTNNRQSQQAVSVGALEDLWLAPVGDVPYAACRLNSSKSSKRFYSLMMEASSYSHKYFVSFIRGIFY